MNNEAIDQGLSAIVKVDVPAAWADAVDEPVDMSKHTKFFREFSIPVNALEGDDLPVSAYDGIEDGRWPTGTCAEEKRGVAMFVPSWDAEKCIGCNQCSFVCPHAAIRPFLMTPDEAAKAPKGYQDKEIKVAPGYKYNIVVSVMDCLGCGSCTHVCPKQALTMKPFDGEEYKAALWDYVIGLPVKANPMDKNTVIGSQFEQPLLEFTGACAGCAETPYCKVVTQLFGDRMMIANAHGCSSVWGGSAPDCGYTKNAQGHGPAWSTSLFEDNAEFALGMSLSMEQQRDAIRIKSEELLGLTDGALHDAIKAWIDSIGVANEGEVTEGISRTYIKELMAAHLTGRAADLQKEILAHKEHIIKKTIWMYGGDGWAYDIGYGGLDHVLAMNANVNIMLVDTEVYSNTGGQSSKATPIGAVAQFAASGRKFNKKDLGRLLMTYGHIYIAQVALGADPNQLIKAIKEAEAYNGPSIIIAYAPCINHGIKGGMGNAQHEMKRAVDCGYWHLYRYNPLLKEEGKNPFILDSKEPQQSFREYLMGETRYAALTRTFPDIAEELFAKAEEFAKKKYETYKELADK